ncbi:MAG: hypothetical protein BGO14_04925 [Chlamydiales bacterium 38-26]|nr:hypothetical protein [Chlamydiales bacterium]OJV07825.1 MAG: hypothetical protein BGO14_04925 [Chlamydiales bacterium 38-26]
MVSQVEVNVGVDARFYQILNESPRGLRYSLEKHWLGNLLLTLFCCCFCSFDRTYWNERRAYLIQHRPPEESPAYNVWVQAVRRVNRYVPHKIKGPMNVTNFNVSPNFTSAGRTSHAQAHLNTHPSFVPSPSPSMRPTSVERPTPVQPNRAWVDTNPSFVPSSSNPMDVLEPRLKRRGSKYPLHSPQADRPHPHHTPPSSPPGGYSRPTHAGPTMSFGHSHNPSAEGNHRPTSVVQNYFN